MNRDTRELAAQPMTEAELDATLIARCAALAKQAADQRAELRARQERGDLTRGPWVPTTRLGQPKRLKKPTPANVTSIRRRA